MEEIIMKKILLITALIGTIGFAGIQIASAHGGFRGGPGPGCCGGYYDGQPNYVEKDPKAWEAFRKETQDIRREIAVKRSELAALMSQKNPDEKKAAELTGQLYDLHTKLEEKAAEKGFDKESFEHGPGMMWRYGWERGRHMMGW